MIEALVICCCEDSLATSPVIIFKKFFKYNLNIDEAVQSMLESWKSDGIRPKLESCGKRVLSVDKSPLVLSLVCGPSACPHTHLQFLERFWSVLQMAVGHVTDETVVKNSLLIHELCHEMVDGGFIQQTTGSKLRQCIQLSSRRQKEESSLATAPAVKQIEAMISSFLPTFPSSIGTAPSAASERPVLGMTSSGHGATSGVNLETDRKPELFLDVVEQLQVIYAADGSVIESGVRGEVKARSFLTGTPHVQLSFPPTLQLSRPEGLTTDACLDTYRCGPGVDDSGFVTSRVLKFSPQRGESTVLSYAVSRPLPRPPPFRLTARVTAGAGSLELALRLTCSHPAPARVVGAHLTVPLPPGVASMSSHVRVASNTAKLELGDPACPRLVWSLPVVPPSSDTPAVFQLRMKNPPPHPELCVGPATLKFEVAGYLCSGLAIKEVKVVEGGSSISHAIQKWSRLVTLPDYYVFLLN